MRAAAIPGGRLNAIAELSRRIALWRKQQELKAAKEWARSLEDQITSGQVALDSALRRVDEIKAEVFSLEDPADIVRRAGAQA